MAEEKKTKEEVAEASMMLDLSAQLKVEMDDAKDFNNQVGQERAESTEYHLGNDQEATSPMQSYYVLTDARVKLSFMLLSILRTLFGTL